MKPEYAIIIKSRTRLEALVERFNTKAQAQFYVERSGSQWSDYEEEHNTFQQALSAVQKQLSTTIKNKIVDRSFLPSFLFNSNQLVVVIGQDGLVANTAKYLDTIPMVAVNPDASRYDGVLLPFGPDNFMKGVTQLMKNEYQCRSCTLAEAKLNDGQRLLAFNDLFIGPASHTSARYVLHHNNREEEQSSSGIIVSTKSGSSGWLSSVYNMTNGMNRFSGKKASDLNPGRLKEDQLMFVVREPFQSRRSQAGIVAGLLDRKQSLKIESRMPDHGLIFSDGIESDFLHFNSGASVQIGIAREEARIVLNN